MAAIRIPIKEFELRLSRGHLAQWRLDGSWTSVRNAAEIICKGSVGRTFWTIFIFFGAEGQDPPPANFASQPGPNTRRAFVFLPREQYAWCVELLRNGDPAVFVWPESDVESAYLTTVADGSAESDLADGTAQGDLPAPPRGPSFAPFRETQMGFSLTNGYLLGITARDVYGDPIGGDTGSVFLEWFRQRYTPWLDITPGHPPKFDLISDNSLLFGSGLNAVVMSNGRFIILAFRGTQAPLTDPLDWPNNFAAGGAPTGPAWGDVPGILIHGGWLNAINEVYPEIIDTISAHRTNNQPLWITGHSMGGAMSLITAYRMHVEGKVVVQGVNTYGGPVTAGGSMIAQYQVKDLQRRTQRWVNNNDWCPLLPIFPYAHVGNARFLDEDGGLDLSAAPPVVAVPSFPDHSIPDYCNKIRGLLSAEVVDQVPL